LRQFNSYLQETIVAAKMIDEEANSEDLNMTLEKIKEFKEKSDSLITDSDEVRP